MSTAPLQQAIAATRGVLAAVTADQMQNATPCDSWDVAGVINHVVGAQHFFGRANHLQVATPTGPRATSLPHSTRLLLPPSPASKKKAHCRRWSPCRSAKCQALQ